MKSNLHKPIINLFKDKYDINSGFDLCEVYLNEINNNLRISQFYIKNTLFLGIILANSSDIKLIFNIELNINSSTVEKLFEDKSYKNKLVFIDEENLRRFFHSSLKGYQKLVYDLI